MTKQYLSGCIADIETLKQELSCWEPKTESCGSSSQMTRVKSKIVKISDINTIPQATPFVEIIKYRLRYSSDDIVAHYKGEDYSYYKIVNRACKLANKLKSYGFNQDDKTGIIIENSINWIVSFVAILFLGGIPVLISHRLSKNELSELVRISRTRFLITSINIELINGNKDIISFSVEDVLADEKFKRDSSLEEIYLSIDRTLQRCDKVILFTSGSTGKPKAVTQPLSNFTYAADIISEKWEIRKNDQIGAFLPFCHSFGFMATFILGIYKNIKIIIPNDMHVTTLIHTVYENRITLLPVVPTMMLSIIYNDNYSLDRVKSLRLISLAGSICAKPQLLDIIKHCPNALINHIYGMTEYPLISISSIRDSFLHIIDTIGQPINGTDVVIDKKSGEILIRGQYGCDAANKGDVDMHGFRHTCDLGDLSDDRYLKICGRLSNIINRGGEKIMPEEVERVILQYDDVQDARVVGIPDDFYGEIVACAVIVSNQSFSQTAIREWLKDKIATFKIPTVFMVKDSFPLLGNGKIDMSSLKTNLCDYARDNKIG